jgi:hypothetical protein
MFKEPDFTEKIMNGPEIELYMMIDYIGGFIWRMNHDMGDGRIPAEHHAGIDSSIVTAREQQHQAVRQCVRFGVEEPIDDKGGASPDYWKWFRWWDSWKGEMGNDEWKLLDAALSRDGGLTADEVRDYRPPGDWRASETVKAEE